METKNWLTLLGISLASFMGMLDLTVVNTALPAIQIEFNSGVAELQWVMNSLLLALTASMVILGKLADLYGRRLFLYIGLALFSLSSLGAGWAQNIDILIISRFVQGLGIALLYTTPLALIPGIFPPSQQGKATGMLVGISSLGMALGPALGGIIVSALGWRWIFFINPPIALICLLLCWPTLKESKNMVQSKKIDSVGFFLLLASIPLFIAGMVNCQTAGFLHPWSGGLILAGLTGMAVLYLTEKRVAAPIINFSFFAQRNFSLGLIANFSLAAFYAIDFFLIPLYLHYIRGQSSDETGFTLLPATIMVALLSPLAGRFADRKGPINALGIGLTLLILSAVIQTQFNADTALWVIVVAYLLFGTGWAFILSPSISAAISSVPADSGGVAAGTIGTFHNFGGTIGLALGTLIFSGAAYARLLSGVTGAQLPAGSWLVEASGNMGQAAALIATHTGLAPAAASALFQQGFLHGYASAMWLIVALPLVSLCAVLLNIRKNNGTGKKQG